MWIKEAFEKELFTELLWPAVAGNVLWSFFSIIVCTNWSGYDWARLLMLFFLLIYLILSWYRSKNLEHGCGSRIFDAIHLVTIIVFAIAIYNERSWIDLSLASIFCITMLGHFFGVWKEPKDKPYHRKILASVSLLGFLSSICIFFCSPEQTNPWSLVVTLGLVLVIWGVVRTIINKEQK